MKHSYLRSETGRLIVALGLKDVTVVDTQDAVLVADNRQTPRIKEIVEQLKREGRPEADHHLRVYRPWGWYQDVDAAPGFRVKRLVVNPGAALSLQRHNHRSEHWVVVTGVAEVTRGEETVVLRANESTYIPVLTKHRLANPGEDALHLVEVQIGGYLGEDDIERFDDSYGRAETS